MRDQHKSRLGLVDEVVGLRKQVEDLKASSVTRRRVEDALRQADEFHRLLLDALPAPVGCLDGGGISCSPTRPSLSCWGTSRGRS